jgi:predicted nucleic acid-binding protein
MAIAQAVEPLVIDCSVVVKWELPGEDYANEALELFYDWKAGAVALCSPGLLPSEIGSVFLRAWRCGRMTQAQAQSSIQSLLGLPFVLQPSSPLVVRAFEIAQRHNQRIYECFYVTLAEREGVDLWTSDERLYNALHIHFPFINFIAHYSRKR